MTALALGFCLAAFMFGGVCGVVGSIAYYYWRQQSRNERIWDAIDNPPLSATERTRRLCMDLTDNPGIHGDPASVRAWTRRNQLKAVS